MAHKVETMAWNGEMPWHKLGKKVSNNLSVKEMQKAAGALWRVEKAPLCFNWEGEYIVTGDKALLRIGDDNVPQYLDRVTSDWNPTQNDVAFEFFHEWVEAGKMEMHTAGVLDRGKYVWALAKLKEGFSLFKGKDKVDSYFLFSNPHRYGQSITIMSTPIRVVCNNTLQLALSGGEEDLTIRVDHRAPFNPEEVKKALDVNRGIMEGYKEKSEFLASKKASVEKKKEFFSRIWPLGDKAKPGAMSRTALAAMKMIEAGDDPKHGQPGAKFGPGTWWQVYNAVTFTHDHKLQDKNENNKLKGIFYGFPRRKKIEALELALEMAGK